MNKVESARIVKAHSARDLGGEVSYNYEDLQQRCENYLAEVRQQTRQMIESAAVEAEQLRQKAIEEGRRAGFQQGLQQADEEIERRSTLRAEKKAAEQLQTALPAIREAVDEFEKERDRWLSHWEESLIALSVAIAEKVLRHHLQLRPELATNMLADVLQLLAGHPRVTIRLHPDDLALLGTPANDVITSMSGCSEVVVIEDDAISRGGCLLETQYSTIDARIETQLERITAELLQSGQ